MAGTDWVPRADPSPEDIERIAAEIRSAWDERTHECRSRNVLANGKSRCMNMGELEESRYVEICELAAPDDFDVPRTI